MNVHSYGVIHYSKLQSNFPKLRLALAHIHSTIVQLFVVILRSQNVASVYIIAMTVFLPPHTHTHTCARENVGCGYGCTLEAHGLNPQQN